MLRASLKALHETSAHGAVQLKFLLVSGARHCAPSAVQPPAGVPWSGVLRRLNRRLIRGVAHEMAPPKMSWLQAWDASSSSQHRQAQEL